MTDLFTAWIEEIIVECHVGFEQIGLNSSGGLHRHFGAVLQDGHWEFGAGHAGKPQTEVSVHLCSANGTSKKWSRKEEEKENGINTYKPNK